MSTNNWNKSDIKCLRLRLGLSQSDMAKKLVCSIEEMTSLENGSRTPNFQQSKLLDLLGRHAENNSFEMQNQPLAEAILDELELAQIEHHKVSDKIQ